MPKISINITNMLTFSQSTGWQRPRLLTDTVFGYDETSGCRAIAYRFVCPQFTGDAKKVLVAVPVRFPANELTMQNFNISVTDTLPSKTDAYNSQTLGEDEGRVGTISAVLSGAGLVQEQLEVPVTSLTHGSDYFIVLSANEESTTTSFANMADCAMLYFPEPSTISIPAKEYHYLGDEITISINRHSSDVAHRISYNFDDQSGVILDAYVEPDSVVWTPPLILANSIPSAMSGTCELVCETLLDDELVGTTAITFMLYVPPKGFIPSVTDVTLTPLSDNTVVSGWKTCVKGFSKVRVAVSASALYGAGITDCEVTIGNSEPLSGFSVTSELLNTAGAIPIYVKVTDTRGQQGTYGTQIYVYPYVRPSLSNIICHRSDDSGTYNMDGTYYFAQATPKYSSIAGKNSCVIEARVKTVGGEYGDAELLTAGTGSVCGGGELSPYRTYVVQIAVKDALNTTPYTVHIPEERNTFKIKDGGRGVGIGVIPTEDDLLDVGFNARFQADVRIDREQPKLIFSVSGMTVGEIGSYSDGPTDGSMYLRVYTASGTYKEYTWSAN